VPEDRNPSRRRRLSPPRAVQDLDHLHSFLLDQLSKRGAIVGFRTSVIYQRVHNPVLSRLPDPGHGGYSYDEYERWIWTTVEAALLAPRLPAR
jgi:hypothetical protein